jgi:GNAT superfamily N-acetyltransferase
VTTRRASYRHTALLCGLVLVGWAWDIALGGARIHALAWIAALILVGGISSLIVHGAKTQPPMPTLAQIEEPPLEDEALDTEIRLAMPEDLADLPDLDRVADVLFDVGGYGASRGSATPEQLDDAALLAVAGQPALGSVRVEIVDGSAHIAQLSVRPKFMKQGIGGSLVEYACSWATSHGYDSITLCTFTDVPWNAPFYATLGFAEVDDPAPGLRELRDEQVPVDAAKRGRRIAMQRRLH